MARKYFGTDGIRGEVGQVPMTADFILRLGWAAGRVLMRHLSGNERGKVVIGKDTRVSGYMFESALEAGLSAAGVDIVLLGPLPTPAVAAIVQQLGAQAGVVISASHNPFQDNGIKFFGADGRKLLDDVELEIEAELAAEFSTVAGAALGKATRINDAVDRYVSFCIDSVGETLSLAGRKIAFDGANGAGYQAGPKLFEALGATVVTTGVSPDGMNINRDCGSTHPEALRALVLAEKADVGIALDGDGDRLVMVDRNGRLFDGDELLYLIARDRISRGKLSGPVVGTLMTNLAIEQAIRELGAEFLRAKVGDRYVLELLDQHQGQLGGESSGHLLCLDAHSTGDGLIAALQVLKAMQHAGKPLDQLLAGVEKFPQSLVNVRLAELPSLSQPDILSAVAEAETRLADSGRVLLRASGTEPVIRVMVEGLDPVLVRELAESIAATVKRVASH